MAIKKRVLVVGTTGDYVESLMESSSSEIVFLTDPQERSRWASFGKNVEVEVLCSLEDHELVIKTLKNHFSKYDISLSGIACFDCESLALASIIAKSFELPFPSLKSVIHCRSKYLSKKLWQEKKVSCPKVALIKSFDDVIRFFYKLNGPAVLKPLTGSGSELVFLCKDEKSCKEAYQCLCEKLTIHSNHRMYTAENMPKSADPHKIFVMEEYIGGEEYSCDFVIENKKVRIIRLVHKALDHKNVLGTVLSYVLPGELPASWDVEKLEGLLLEAALALGLKRTIAMVDFKIEKGDVYLIEMTPRPGGDCLPPLIYASSGFNMLTSAINFAKGEDVFIPKESQWKKMIGMHLVSTTKGTIKDINAKLINADKRVVSCFLKRKIGDKINLPPDDYDSRMLGYVIFKPKASPDDSSQCQQIAKKLVIQWENDGPANRSDLRKGYQRA